LFAVVGPTDKKSLFRCSPFFFPYFTAPLLVCCLVSGSWPGVFSDHGSPRIPLLPMSRLRVCLFLFFSRAPPSPPPPSLLSSAFFPGSKCPRPHYFTSPSQVTIEPLQMSACAHSLFLRLCCFESTVSSLFSRSCLFFVVVRESLIFSFAPFFPLAPPSSPFHLLFSHT